jgi:hypothetical protein
MITVYSNITSSLHQHAIPPARIAQWNINNIRRISITRDGNAEIRAVYKHNQRRSWYVTVNDLNEAGLPLEFN